MSQEIIKPVYTHLKTHHIYIYIPLTTNQYVLHDTNSRSETGIRFISFMRLHIEEKWLENDTRARFSYEVYISYLCRKTVNTMVFAESFY